MQEMLIKHNIYMQNCYVPSLIIDNNLEQRYLKHQHSFMGIFMDLNCSNSTDVLYKANTLNLYNEHFLWLLYDDYSNLRQYENLFANFSLTIATNIEYFNKNENNFFKNYNNFSSSSSFTSYDIYNNGQQWGGHLNITIDRKVLCFYDNCSVTEYLSSLYTRQHVSHRDRLSDVTLRACIIVTRKPLTLPQEKLLAYLKSVDNKTVDGIARFAFQVLMVLKQALASSFSYDLKNSWSTNETSGGCIGAIGMDYTADLMSSPIMITSSRKPYLTPILSTGIYKSVCIFRTPHNINLKAEMFLAPFNHNVWMSFGFLLLAVAVLLWLSFFMEYQINGTAYLIYLPSFFTTCLMSLGSACVQSTHLIPNSLSGRIIFFTLSLLTFIIYNYYTSVVVAILLGSPVKSSIKTMAQVADSNLEVAMEPLPFNVAYLNYSTLPEIRRFSRRKIERKKAFEVWLSAEEGVKRVRDKSGFAFIFEAFAYDLVFKHFTSEEICDLNEVPFRPWSALYQHVHRDSPFTEIIRTRLMRILESGLYNKHYRYWVNIRLHCYKNSNSLLQVGLEYTAPLFLMLAVAYLIVLIVCFIEILWKRNMKNKL